MQALSGESIPDNLPRRGVERLVGRTEELEQLHQMIWQNNRPTLTAIVGMRGIGKTELALHYALNYKPNYLGGVCWLQAGGNDTSSQESNIEINVGTQIVQFGRSCLQLNPPESLSLRDQVRFCWNHWNSGKDVLIVLDDVTHYLAIEPLLPPQRSQFKVLITTPLRLDLPNYIPLDVLDITSALELLKWRLKPNKIEEQEMETARVLCERLDKLPLALNLVGGYMKKYRFSPTKMLQRLEQKGLNHPSLALNLSDQTQTQRIDRGIATAFELSWDELNESAQQLGCFLSLFALAPIPWVWIENSQLMEEEELEDARVKLEDFHLIQGENSYNLLRLIRDFFQSRLTQISQAEYIQRLICQTLVTVSEHLPERPNRQEIKCFSAIAPHWIEAATALEPYLDNANLIVPFINLGRFYQGQGFYQEACIWYEKCLAVAQERFGLKHSDVAISYRNLGLVHFFLGNAVLAEQEFLQALNLRKELIGETSIEVADTLNLLAVLYRNSGQLDSAKAFAQQSLDLRGRLLQPEHLDVAESLMTLATVLFCQQQYEEVELLYLRVLSLRKRFLGNDHADTVETINGLALLYEKLNRLNEAEALHLEAIECNTRMLSEDHPNVASSLNNLAGLYRQQHRFAQAERLYLRAIATFQATLGQDHPSVGRCLDNLGMVYFSLQRSDEAELTLLQAYRMLEMTLGTKHPWTQRCQQNLESVRNWIHSA
jgi:tetratricopeptide (TPR) repeat protein